MLCSWTRSCVPRLCDLAQSLSQLRKLVVRFFLGSVRSIGRSLAHRRANLPGSGLSPRTDISDRRIYVKTKPVSRGGKGRKVDPGIVRFRRLGAVAAPGRDARFPLSKRRSSFVIGFWIFFSWKGFSPLCMAVLALTGVDFAAPRVDYIIWKAECETKPYLPGRESNILTYCFLANVCHIQGTSRLQSEMYLSLCFIIVTRWAVIYSAALGVYIAPVLYYSVKSNSIWFNSDYFTSWPLFSCSPTNTHVGVNDTSAKQLNRHWTRILNISVINAAQWQDSVNLQPCVLSVI